MGYSINMEYSPSEIVYLGKDRVKIDGIHIDENGLRYHVKPVDIRWNTVFKVKEEHLSKEPRTDVGFICDNCGKLVPDEETYHKYHGCCSGECELKIISRKLDGGILVGSSVNINPSSLNIEIREDFFKDMTDYDIQKINTLLKNNKLRFY